jgi:hypothetical protein
MAGAVAGSGVMMRFPSAPVVFWYPTRAFLRRGDYDQLVGARPPLNEVIANERLLAWAVRELGIGPDEPVVLAGYVFVGRDDKVTWLGYPGLSLSVVRHVLLMPGQELMQGKRDFVGMRCAPCNNALELQGIVGDGADFHQFGFDDLRVSHSDSSMAHAGTRKPVRETSRCMRYRLNARGQFTSRSCGSFSIMAGIDFRLQVIRRSPRKRFAGFTKMLLAVKFC